MFVEIVQNNGNKYIRLVQSIRAVNSNGLKVSKKKVIKNVGPLAKFDDGQPDYVKRLKESFKNGSPLIPELKPYCEETDRSETYHFSIRENTSDCVGHPRLYCHLFLERILEEIGLRNFFASYKGRTKIEYDVYGFAKLLIFGRLLNPASKCATVRQNDDYYAPILKDFNPDNVYDTLDFIAENRERIIKRIHTNLTKKLNRSSDIIFYDVTNFYYETEDPDEDILDEDGNVIEKGIRKMGVSKENRKQPIVQMGLFMDNSGIPIAFESFPGNTLDHQTVRPALSKHISGLELSRFIMIADRGICNYKTVLELMNSGNGYIMSKSLLKCKKQERQWAYDDDGYIHSSKDFKYKSRIVKHSIKDDNGKTCTIEEKVVVYWSRKFYERSLKENARFLELLDRIQEAPHNFRISSNQSKALRRFFKKECVNIDTGEVIRSSDLKLFIDYDEVNRFKESMGYYQIITSERDMDDLEIIEKYHGLTQIEEQFKTMKSTLETRPLYVRTKDHINAHLTICFIALVIMRLIQNRLMQSGTISVDDDTYWGYGMSAERIQDALKKWKVDSLPDELYRFTDIDDPDLSLIFKAFGINIPLKLYRAGDLKQLKTGIDIFK